MAFKKKRGMMAIDSRLNADADDDGSRVSNYFFSKYSNN